MAEEQISFDIYQPFGPSVLKTKLPQIYVDALNCLLYTSPSPRDRTRSRMPSSA
mgnify:CR=1 FL=1